MVAGASAIGKPAKAPCRHRQQPIILDVKSERDFKTGLATFVQRWAGALLAGSGAFTNSDRQRFAALMLRETTCSRPRNEQSVVPKEKNTLGGEPSWKDNIRAEALAAGTS
jgi:hypothetical protein